MLRCSHVAGDEAAADQLAPLLSPLLLASCWQSLEQMWADQDMQEALRSFLSSEQAAPVTPLLGAYLQLHGVPALPVIQQSAALVQQVAHSQHGAAAALLAAQHPTLSLAASQALAAALLSC